MIISCRAQPETHAITEPTFSTRGSAPMSFAPTAPVSTACVAVDRWEHPCSDVEAEPAERAPDAIWCKFVQSAADADRASDTNARPITTAVPTDSKPWWFKAITTFFRPMTGQSSPQPLPLNLLPSTFCPQPFALNLTRRILRVSGRPPLPSRELSQARPFCAFAPSGDEFLRVETRNVDILHLPISIASAD